MILITLQTSSSPLSSSGRKRIEKEYLWRPYFQFQSHEVCFDFLKSQPIDEKINNIEILKLPAQEKVVLLTANDKTMKLWKVTHRIPHVTHAVQGLEKERGRYAGKTSTQSVDDRGRGITSSCLRLPTRVTAGANTIPSASPRQIFENGHSYHINSVSMNADGRTFLRYNPSYHTNFPYNFIPTHDNNDTIRNSTYPNSSFVSTPTFTVFF